MKDSIVWLDFETGGLDSKQHQIVQAGAIATDMALNQLDHGIEIKFQLVPGRFTAEALEMNSYSEAEWQDALPRGRGMTALDDYLQQHKNHTHITKKGKSMLVTQLAGHNLSFDVDFLRAAYGSRWCPASSWTGGYWDTLQFAKWVTLKTGRTWKNHTLEGLCEENGIEILAHDAYEDVKATIELARALLDCFDY